MKIVRPTLLLAACVASTLTSTLPLTAHAAAAAKTAAPKAALTVDYQKFTLPNGLEVIFHIDRSDPVVAVNLTAHVGSAREKAGRTGFAHLFEHLLFLESENLGKGGLDKMTARIGGSGANGSTSQDRTNYLQTVPKDALEKMIWAEADKLGWFINTVTEPVLAKEKQVVKNEKRQGVDNAPYGHTRYVINKALYPENHPYNWQVIGSLDDLQNATLDDVKEFFRLWYVPNNVTLVLAGDFDPVQARKWVEKYFSEIKRGDAIPALVKRPGVLKQTVKLAHEDNFAKLPELTMAWPTVEDLHPDSYALEVLAEYLSETKRAPFYKVLVEDTKLAPAVQIGNQTAELAGQFMLRIRAFEGKPLDEVAGAVNQAFAKFEEEGISEKDLNRIKAGLETRFYNSVSSVLGKSALLAEYNYLSGNPGYVAEGVKKTLAVTTADVRRVYDTYIKGKPFVATSFVPRGKLALALTDSAKAEVVEEKVVQGAENAVDPTANAEYTKTPSTFDRSKEPPYGEALAVKVPQVWNTMLANGMRVVGIENREVPLVQFDIAIDGGLLLDKPEKVGVANLMARMLTQGTARKTPQELEEAILQLGATINVTARTEDVRISVTTLARNYRATLDLVQEILLQPRWDEKEFALIKQSVLSQIRQQEADPNALAAINFSKLVYAKDDLRSRNILGTAETVNAITIDDLKRYYSANLSPSNARMHVVGALPKAAIAGSLAGLNRAWKAKPVALPAATSAAGQAPGKVYFVDVPDAKQSVLQVGYRALAATDPDYYPATVMNYILGGGGFASRLTQQLREGKGYTYGITSNFSGSKSAGPFIIASGVRSNVTLESTQLVKQILQDYPATYSAADLETTRNFLVKSNARAFETSAAKLAMLDNISKYGWRADYVKEREGIVKAMTLPRIQALSEKYLDPSQMVWLVVGDAKTQLPRMKELGFDEPVVIGK
ncbi:MULTISPECIES: pitrilysin family protein [unclassified Massilia]|uniref:M16 family metallopeptidase n=1 Tax=unclassified Massilia TaxID=2609279 RepID=UPI0017820811|nr:MULTISPECIES: pitrilysin family protein [unclassified Massilia]MBD8532497.1 insulinase family protein [Massilia sp. CFBP 13647]MBD8675867.1 insulinase family protein [Massilia sp. CFBP 13721]